jgi:cytochrome c oxidase subunit 2
MSTPRPGRDRRNIASGVHWRRLLVMWLVLTAIAEPLLYLVLGPHLPPGDMTDAAQGDQFDATVLTMIAVPVVIAVLEYYIYALVMWRHRRGEEMVDGPALHGHLGVQAGWIAITSAIVFGAFIFGTYELIVPAGAGGGEGPSPIWVPASKDILPVQVIGQQWSWTYRYPTFGGMETTQLVLPDNTAIAFHVTSLDVIHDFWAYQLGVKADANPQIDNVAFATTRQLGSITVRCDELCGIWHGAMFNYGRVVSQRAFEQWGTSTEHRLAALTKTLPKFAWTYVPSANGAAGSYYPSEDPFLNTYQYEYGKSGAEGRLPAVKVSHSPKSK